jgi:O-antigen/teichoic acid export membrane protein
MGKIIKGIYTGYLNSAAKLIIGFFMTPFVIGQIGKEGFSVFILLAGTMEILRLFDLGNSGALLILVSRSNKNNLKEINHFFNTSLFVQLGLVVIVLIFGILLSFVLPDYYNLQYGNLFEIQYVIIGLAFYIAISMLSNTFTSILQSFNELSVSNNVKTFGYLMQVLSIVLCLWLGLGLISLMIGYLLNAIFTLITNIIYAVRIDNLMIGFRYFSLRLLKEEYSHLIFWLALGSINLYIIQNIDVVIVAKIITVEIVAVLSISKRLYSLFNSFTNQLTNNLRPSLGNMMGNGDLVKAFKLFKILCYVSFAFVASISFSFYTINENFISWWVGEGFYIGNLAEYGILISLIITSLVLPFRALLSAAKIVKPVSIARLIEGIIKLSLAIVLGLFYGVEGIIYSVFISTVLVSAWYLPYLVNKKIKFTGFNSFSFIFLIRVTFYIIISTFLAFIAKNYIDQPFPVLFSICFIINSLIAFVLVLDNDSKIFIKKKVYNLISVFK